MVNIKTGYCNKEGAFVTENIKSSVNERREISRESIRLALFQLMAKKSYNDITVTDICKRAGVSRNAYYRNYSNKDEIIRDYLETVTVEFLKTSPKRSTREFYKALFEHLITQKDIMLLLQKQNLTLFLIEIFNEYSLQWETANSDNRYADRHTSGGILFVALMWIEEGMKETPEEMAEIILNIRVGYCQR